MTTRPSVEARAGNVSTGTSGGSSTWSLLQALCAVPHRTSGTEGERQAAGWLAQELAAMGYRVERQPFRAPAATLYAGPPIVGGVVALAAVVAARVDQVAVWWAGGILALLMLVPLVGELLLKGVNFDALLPRRPSANVVAHPTPAPPGGAAAGVTSPAGRVVVVAHYDTQRASWLFAPGVVRYLGLYFQVAYVALGVTVVALWGGAVSALGGLTGQLPSGAGATWRAVAEIGGWVTAAWMAVLAASGLFGRPVNGANDNGSGCAVALALARRFSERKLAGVELVWLFTGSEEVGTRGMMAFLRAEAAAARRGAPHPPTWFVNLDNVGGGQLRALTVEGMLLPWHAGRVLQEVAAELMAEGRYPLTWWRRRLLLTTDGAPVAARGGQVLTFIGLEDDGRIPNYHWPTDTPQHVDPARLEQVYETVAAFLERLAGRLSARC